MTKTAFTDFDECADAINGIAGRFVPTARSTADWWVQVVPLGRVAIQQLQTGGATTFAGDGSENTITIGIPLIAPKRIRVDGGSLEDDSFILVREGQPFTATAGQITRWAGLTVPIDHASLAPELLDALTLRAMDRGSNTHTRTELPRIARVRLLISRLCAEDGGTGVLEPAAARAAEEELVAITSYALEASSRAKHRRTGRPRYHRDRVIAKALVLMEEREGQPILLQDLCRASGVSERTLRNVFQEYFGVGPMRLLKVRQLREIQSALRNAEFRGQRVADIASRFGVWDLSSFQRNYKALYGELPSQTRRRPPVVRDRDSGMNATWLEFALRRFIDTIDAQDPETPELRVDTKRSDARRSGAGH